MRLAVPDELPENVILVGLNGQTTVTDQVLTVQHSHTFEGDSEYMNTFFFGHSQATFVPNRRSLKEGVVVVSLVKTRESLRLHIIGVERKGIKVLADLALPAKLVSTFCPLMILLAFIDSLQKNVLDSSCSASGFVSLLGLHLFSNF